MNSKSSLKQLLEATVFSLAMFSSSLLSEESSIDDIWYVEFEKVNSKLPGTRAIDIYEDAQGTLWVGTENGLAFKNGSEFMKLEPRESNIQGNTVIDIRQDKNSSLLVGTGQGLNVLRKGATSFELLTNENAQAKYSIKALTDTQSNIWSLGESVVVFLPDGRIFDFKGEILGAFDIKQLSTDSVLIFTIGNGIYEVDISTFEVKDNKKVKSLLWAVAELRDGRLLVFGEEEVHFIVESLTNVESISTKRKHENASVLMGAGVQVTDSEVWVNNASGVYSFNLDSFDYKRVRSFSEPDKPIRVATSIFLTEDGTLLIGTNKGLLRTSTSNLQSKLLTNEFIRNENSKSISLIASISEVEALIAFSSGVIARYNINTSSLITVSTKLAGKASIQSIVRIDSSNWLIISTSNSKRRFFYSLDIHSNAITPTDIVTENTVLPFVDSRKRVWSPGERDGNLYVKSGSDTKVFKPDGSDKSIPAGIINRVQEDENGNIWVPSYFGGLTKVDANLSKLKKYKLKEQFPLASDKIIKVLFCGDEVLVITDENIYNLSSNGRFSEKIDNFRTDFVFSHAEMVGELIYIQKADGSVFIYDLSTNKYFTSKPVMSSEQGMINQSFAIMGDKAIFAKKEGFVVAPIPEAPKDSDGINIRVKQLTVDSMSSQQNIIKSISPLDRTINSRLRLLPDDYRIKIDFSANNFTNGKSNKYSYRLTGRDTSWIELSDPKLDLIALPPGEYSLDVKFNNSDGTQRESISILNFAIEKPLWLRWYALAFYLVIILIALVLLFRFRTRYLMRQKLALESQVEKKTKDLTLQNEHIKKQEEELKSLLLSKEQFLANVSHEFRTPITLIMGQLKNLSEKNGAEKSKEVIRRNSSRLLNMVEEILELSAPKVRKKLQRFEIGELTSVFVEDFRLIAHEKKMNIVSNVKVRAELILNQGVIEKLFSNIMTNFLKYCSEGDTLTIDCHRTDGGILLSFVDDGPGITDEKLENILVPYHLSGGEAHLGDYTTGFGMGIPLVNKLVKENNGRFELCNREQGGVEISIFLETYISDSKTVIEDLDLAKISSSNALDVHHLTSKVAEHSSIEESDSKPSILVVDDNVDMLNYIVDIFVEDFDVFTAQDGNRGFELAKKNIPDVIVSDVMMPNCDGFEFTKLLRTETATCHIPVVLLTAKDEKSAKVKGLELAADDYITKPFDEELLAARVNNLISIRNLISAGISSTTSGVMKSEDIIVNPSFLCSKDEQFIEKIDKLIEQNISNHDFGVNDIAKGVFLSPSQLRKKLKAISGKTPNERIRIRRLEAAYKMLREGKSIQESFFSSGFTSQSYFNSCFKAYYGKTPGALLEDTK